MHEALPKSEGERAGRLAVAGRALDAEVAEKVMGWVRLRGATKEGTTEWDDDGVVLVSGDHVAQFYQKPVEIVSGPITNYGVTPHYSTDIAAAWDVHLDLCERLFSVRRRYYLALQEDATADLERAEDATVRVAWPDVLTVLRQRFPESVCLAALKAVESP